MKKIKSFFKNTFFKYIIISITSFIIDVLLFTIFNYFLENIFKYESVLIATIIARIMSSLYNYFCNAKFVFNKHNYKTFIKYYELVIVQMIISAIVVYLINRFLFNTATIIKIFVDTVIFVINYVIQKKVVFK